MTIKSGGQLECFGKSGQKLEQIKIYKSGVSRSFELLIISNNKDNGLPDESLSYLSIDELLDLKEEINQALNTLII